MRELAKAPENRAKLLSHQDVSSSFQAELLNSDPTLKATLLMQACAMAPVAVQSVLAQKRPLSTLADELHPSKKPRQSYHRHHSLHWKPQTVPAAEPAIIEQNALDKLFVDTIKAICEEQGARLGVHNPVIESLALEAFRNATEEFVLKLCAMMRRSMLSARRTAPIPSDFEFAIRCLDLPWPDDQLKPFTTQPTINPPLLPTPPPEDEFHREYQLPTTLLGPSLDGKVDKRKDHYIPSHLPPFPSQHTYKNTPVFPAREVDPRRIRELATEEGKLGEEALRKLAGAVKVENTIGAGSETQKVDNATRQKGPSSREEIVESIFEATIRDLLKSASDGVESRFELGPIVNCEKRFLMQDSAPTTRRRQPDPQGPLLVTSTAGPNVKLSEKARGKQRGEDVVQDEEML